MVEKLISSVYGSVLHIYGMVGLQFSCAQVDAMVVRSKEIICKLQNETVLDEEITGLGTTADTDTVFVFAQRGSRTIKARVAIGTCTESIPCCISQNASPMDMIEPHSLQHIPPLWQLFHFSSRRYDRQLFYLRTHARIERVRSLN